MKKATTNDMDKTSFGNENNEELGRLVVGMREAYLRGENVMDYARKLEQSSNNSVLSTLIAYDLQAGSYIQYALQNAESKALWCKQLSEILNPYIFEHTSILEVGCGEATTLSGVLQGLHNKPLSALGFDISWSRCAHGKEWLKTHNTKAELFVADLFNIPLEDSSIDVVYTSHSLEPNGGRELEALSELLRVARHAVILVEPIYELADAKAQERMGEHGYIRGLKEVITELGASVRDYRLLDYTANPLNPSGLIIIEKSNRNTEQTVTEPVKWRCPLTHEPMTYSENGFYSSATGIVYPILAGIPLLETNHAVIASSFEGLGLIR